MPSGPSLRVLIVSLSPSGRAFVLSVDFFGPCSPGVSRASGASAEHGYTNGYTLSLKPLCGKGFRHG